jgi:proliferating cell nuclear antigen
MGRLGKHTKEIVLKEFPFVEKGETKINQNNSLELKTGKSHIIKILLECMKHLITDVNIIFFPNSNVNGVDFNKISISVSDTTETVGIFIDLDTNEFEHYFCDKKTIVGVNIKDFYKVVNSTGKNDILFLYMENNNYDYLCVRTENENNKEISISSIKTIDRQEECLIIPNVNFDCCVSLSSQKLQKICKNFNNINTLTIEITIDGEILKFKTKEGDMKREELINTENNNLEGYNYSGSYNLKYLYHFVKATPLTNTVSIYIKNDGFLMLKYNVVDVGELRFILTEE